MTRARAWAASSPPRSLAAAPSSATVGQGMPRSRTSSTTPRWSGQWPRTSSCLGCTGSSPTRSGGGLGVYHGLRPQHLQAYLDEFVFRFHRRYTPAAAFERLLGLTVGLPTSYEML